MDNQIKISTELYDDEVVCFLADRYHTTPKIVLQSFLAQDKVAPQGKESGENIRLEDNEIEILRGLTCEHK